MSSPNDARALRSREALKAALLTLVEERPFDQISIRDITSQAGVSYPVFFRRYGSREQLLEDIATEEVRKLLLLTSPMFDADRQVESVRALCAYVSDHRQLWSRLLTGGAAPIMREEFQRIAKEIRTNREPANPWIPADLAAAFVVSGLFEILVWWLNQPEDYPTERIVGFIEVLIVRLASMPIDTPPIAER